MIRKSVKKGLNAVISSAFRRRENVASDDVTLSGSASECSTLVDFIIYEPEETMVTAQEPHPTTVLLDDNQAWNSREPCDSPQALPYPLNTSGITQWSDSQPSLLDEEECTWVMPRPRARGAARGRRKTLFSKKIKPSSKIPAPCPSVDLLEPDERSWM